MDKFLRLHQELHARPLPDVRVESTVFHLAMFRGDVPISLEREHLDRLVCSLAASIESAGDSHLQVAIGSSSLRVEFHTEFTEYTFIKNSLSEFDHSPTFEIISEDWIDAIPGETVNRLQICVEQVVEYGDEKDIEKLFNSDSMIASNISDSQMRVWSDYLLSAAGNTRFLLQAKTSDTDRIGRAVQRLIDIENYRMLAFIGLQKAREIAPPLSQIESKLENVMQTFKEIESIVGEKTMLDDLINLAADVELLKTRAMNRFRATDAYAEIMAHRLQELREEKVEGVFSISAFLLRRSEPAFRTCRSTRDRILDLSLRVSRAAELLRTRIDVQIEEQNQLLLSSVDRRASLQNRLQLTIEWFSVFAISVYLLQLVRIFLDAASQLNPAINPLLVTGLIAPAVLIGVALIINVIRRKYHE